MDTETASWGRLPRMNSAASMSASPNWLCVTMTIPIMVPQIPICEPPPSLRLVDVPVNQLHPVPRSADMIVQRPGDRDRSMPATRAAHRDAQMRLALPLIQRNQEVDQLRVFCQEGARLRGVQHELTDLRRLTVQRLQLRNEIRVEQKAYIHEQIRLRGQAVFESEREQVDLHGYQRPVPLDHLRDLRLQRVHIQGTRIDDVVGGTPQRLQQLNLGPDPGEKPLIPGQGMLAPG